MNNPQYKPLIEALKLVASFFTVKSALKNANTIAIRNNWLIAKTVTNTSAMCLPLGIDFPDCTVNHFELLTILKNIPQLKIEQAALSDYDLLAQNDDCTFETILQGVIYQIPSFDLAECEPPKQCQNIDPPANISGALTAALCAIKIEPKTLDLNWLHVFIDRRQVWASNGYAALSAQISQSVNVDLLALSKFDAEVLSKVKSDLCYVESNGIECKFIFVNGLVYRCSLSASLETKQISEKIITRLIGLNNNEVANKFDVPSFFFSQFEILKQHADISFVETTAQKPNSDGHDNFTVKQLQTFSKLKFTKMYQIFLNEKPCVILTSDDLVALFLSNVVK